nr:hypothetical protein [Tanacetum cinerariifolium]
MTAPTRGITMGPVDSDSCGPDHSGKYVEILSLDMMNFFDLLLLELYFAAPSDLKRLMGRVAVMELSKKRIR